MEHEFYCQGCQNNHLAALWYVRERTEEIAGKTGRKYLCGERHFQLPSNERGKWILLEGAP